MSEMMYFLKEMVYRVRVQMIQKRTVEKICESEEGGLTSDEVLV